jgi:OOP family OmpA-OmpF porin
MSGRIAARILTIGLLSAGLMSVALTPDPLAAQEIRETLFRTADQARAAAEAARAGLLAPEAWNEAMELYRRAEQDLERGRDLNDIRGRLERATQYFRQATEATELARVTFANTLAAREDAVNAEAATFAPEPWRDAEERFEDAARELEDGDVNGARRESDRALQGYREAELAAIKANYLNETWALLEEAEALDVDDRAPITLRRARDLVASAEQLLTENRYDTDEARSLAQEAKREAQHAIYLAQSIRTFRDDDGTLEELMLRAEQPVQRIAGVLEIPIAVEEGLQPPTNAVIGAIQTLQDSVQSLRNALGTQREMVATLEARVDELESRLGGVQEERSELARRVEAQAQLERRFTTVELMFDRDEGRVLREGNNVILRLYGLTFNVGSANIESRFFPLLTQVQEAINTFPEATVTIEGHTDSFGGDEANMRLSQERADAVREYLLANMSIDPPRIDAVGHGETQPVASNETEEGRARNRRIDVVIHPRIGS